MRIGVVPNLDRGGGGIYQYAVTLVAALPDVIGSGDELIVFLYGGESLPDDLAARPYRCVAMRSAPGPAGAMWYRLASMLSRGARTRLKGIFGRAGDPGSLVEPAWRSFFERHGIDLLIFTTDVDLAYRTGVPFVVAIHDIQHRLQPEFPEVSADGEWERRESRIGNCVRHASGILVDSEVGRQDILAVYAPDEDAVSIVPFVPANYLPETVTTEQVARVRSAYGLPDRFLFYPAAFWPHKNHLRIVEAIARLREQGLDAPIVLVGPNSGPRLRCETFDAAIAAADSLSVGDLVTYLGYVEDETMSALYAGATALLMPTFFGPTNIPVVEAFRFGCPVITSDIRGIREQVADAAVLVDPGSVTAIADGVRRVFEEPGLAGRLRQAGYAHLEAYSHSDYKQRLRMALRRALSRIEAAR